MKEILTVDLTSRDTRRETLADEILEKYLGGRGLGAYLLYKNTGQGADPLSPDNVLVFSGGPVQGTIAPYSSKTMLHTKSPLTGIYLYSAASSTFGHHLAGLGLAALIVKGKCDTPGYIRIKMRGEVSFHSAEGLWGRDPAYFYQQAPIGSALKTACVCIGRAGENLVRLATIVTGNEATRAFGRGGSGSVMGSKNLKGIVIESGGKAGIADPAGFRSALVEVRKKLEQNPQWVQNRKKYGSGSDMMSLNLLGILPTRNWQGGVFPGTEKIAPTENTGEFPRESVPCGPYCYSPCSHKTRIRGGHYEGFASEGPEYETIYSFGSNCGVDRFDAIVAAEALCDRYGLDTMSVGVAVGFGMECYEKGLIGKDDLGGADLRFGNHEAMVEMVRQIGENTGFGKVLGRGVREASGLIPGSGHFAMHSKGLELGGLECRGAWGQALEYVLSSRGGCHHALGRPALDEAQKGTGTRVEGKGELIKRLATDRILYDCAVLCTFTRKVLGLDVLAGLVNSIRGSDTTVDEFKITALRVLNLERLFNVREGVDRSLDVLPGRLTGDPLPDGPNMGARVPLGELLDEGYNTFGWDVKTGVPLAETLEELGLGDLR